MRLFLFRALYFLPLPIARPLAAAWLVAERARIEKRRAQLADAEQIHQRRRAAEVMARAWATITMAPCCPHCSRGITPDDVVKNRNEMVSVDYGLASRNKP